MTDLHPRSANSHTPIDELVAAVGPVGMRVDLLDETTASRLGEHLRGLAPADKIALLKAAVAWMPQYRGPDATSTPGAVGPLLYETARRLFKARLPLTEDDLCDLLRLAQHDCGHGSDTRAPFDLARNHQRRHGYSPMLAAAIRDFVDDLPPARATTVREIRRSADLLAVLDPATPIAGRAASRTPWIERVRRSLAEVPEPELGTWQQLVLEMAVTERMSTSKKWGRVAQGAIDELGEALVLARLRGWWPPAGEQVSLERGGLPLLKHFLWLLSLVPGEDADRRVAAVASMTWYPPREPLGVLKPAVAYLREHPSPQTAEPLSTLEQRLAAATSV